jgi:hypothetical protein
MLAILNDIIQYICGVVVLFHLFKKHNYGDNGYI